MRRYILALIVLVALGVRLLLAPGSAGSDIPQFLGFARSMAPGLCMYQNAVPQGEDWPYPWPYPYGPLLLLILKILYNMVCPCSLETMWVGTNYIVKVDPYWAFTLKSIFIIFDIIIIIIIYVLYVSRDEKTAIILSAAYALSPMVLYVTAIYGMFDSIPTALFLLGLLLHEKSRPLAGLLMGIAAGAKQTLMLPALAATIALGPPAVASALLGLGLSTIPFIACPTSTAFYALASRIIQPGPVEPIVYSFNGLSSLATYFYRSGWEGALAIVKFWPLPFMLLASASIYISTTRRDPIVAAAFGYAAFVATYWRVNPQYMLTLTALGLVALPRLHRKLRIPLAVAVIAANLWPLLYPVEFWYYVHMETPGPAHEVVGIITLDVTDLRAYVVLSLTITLSLYILVLWGLVLCRRNMCSSEV